MAESGDEMLVSEAAQRFGAPKRTLQSAIERGALPARRVGPLWLVTAGAVQRWLRHGKHRPGPAKRPRPAVTPALVGG